MIQVFSWPETTYNQQEKTRNDMKWPETSWNNLLQAQNKLKPHTTSKKQPTMTCNKQVSLKNNLLEGNHVTKNKFCICNMPYHLHICKMMACRKIKINVRTKRSKTKKHWIITWLTLSLVYVSWFWPFVKTGFKLSQFHTFYGCCL